MGTVTRVLSITELFAGFGSLVVELAVNALVIMVPAAVEAFTASITVMFTLDPAARLPSEQVITPADNEQEPTVGVAETKVTPAGSVSVTMTAAADVGLGPLFVTVSWYVMLFPASTGFGDTLPEMATSACPAVATTTLAVDVLFPGRGSGVEEPTNAEFVMFVPLGVLPSTFKTSVNVPE